MATAYSCRPGNEDIDAEGSRGGPLIESTRSHAKARGPSFGTLAAASETCCRRSLTFACASIGTRSGTGSDGCSGSTQYTLTAAGAPSKSSAAGRPCRERPRPPPRALLRLGEDEESPSKGSSSIANTFVTKEDGDHRPISRPSFYEAALRMFSRSTWVVCAAATSQRNTPSLSTSSTYGARSRRSTPSASATTRRCSPTAGRAAARRTRWARRRRARRSRPTGASTRPRSAGSSTV